MVAFEKRNEQEVFITVDILSAYYTTLSHACWEHTECLSLTSDIGIDKASTQWELEQRRQEIAMFLNELTTIVPSLDGVAKEDPEEDLEKNSEDFLAFEDSLEQFKTLLFEKYFPQVKRKEKEDEFLSLK
ncbi:hypothetical protein FNV43_RR00351 [Rhamnella rubrinervis]|uniref:Uncharacterized protein n=1 Tax=Rhamnella rubrinervis TaxID=2594499 RepID=A0A8K0HP01_9ROSA|nr:hypothetical protein FNV43_RR00351 [Rhamnella rubrinervis]